MVEPANTRQPSTWLDHTVELTFNAAFCVLDQQERIVASRPHAAVPPYAVAGVVQSLDADTAP